MTTTRTPDRLALHVAEHQSPQALRAAFNAAFADYLIGPFQLTEAQWPATLARHGSVLSLSRVVLGDAEILAFAFTAPRENEACWRLSAMGALPAARGSGAAQALLEDFLERAAAAGCQRVELEVFAQNERARRLYERHGFSVRDALYGYRGPLPAAPHADLQELGWPEALDWVAEAATAGLALPMQQSRQSLRSLQGQRAWRLGSALVCGSQVPDDPTRFNFSAIIDRDPGQRDLRVLLQALAAQLSGVQTWFMPQILRPALGGDSLAALGLAPEPLHQLWMQRDL